MPELADRRHVLPDPGVVQELSGRGIDRGVDVHPEQDGPAREVEVVHREEIPGHSSVTERPNVIVFWHRVQARGTGSGESGSDTHTRARNLFTTMARLFLGSVGPDAPDLVPPRRLTTTRC